MVEKTALIKADNKPNGQSKKTTIPRSILTQWNLKTGDELLWELAILVETGEMVVIVRPAQPQILPKVKSC